MPAELLVELRALNSNTLRALGEISGAPLSDTQISAILNITSRMIDRTPLRYREVEKLFVTIPDFETTTIRQSSNTEKTNW